MCTAMAVTMTRPDRAAQVQRPLLQGRQAVDALWFPAAWFDEAAAAARLLAGWRTGSRAFRFDAGLVLRFATAIDVSCEAAGGWALSRDGGALASAPLSDAERAQLPAADLWIVTGARVHALHWSEARVVDPADWLDIDGYALHDTYDCRAAVSDLPTVIAPPRDLRTVLAGAVPPPSPAQVEFLRRLGAGQALTTRRRKLLSDRFVWPALAAGAVLAVAKVAQFSWPPDRPRAASAPASSDFGLALGAALIAALAGLAFASRGFWIVPMGARGRSAAAAPADSLPARPRPGQVAPQRWRGLLARLAIALQLSRLLGYRQAAYLSKLFRMFEQGDLDQALRHAIPLGAAGAGLGQAFGVPAPRASLTLSGATGPGARLAIGKDLEERLKTLYRQSFERLDRAGRIDEAVFVLAELLRAHKEALDYLEQHERFAQAAELALAWHMTPDLIVRLHCLAGDWRTALAVARRDNAFANTTLQLAAKWPDAAKRLRLEWAEALAVRGDWLQAVEVIWPIKEARDQAASWLRSAEAAGGALGARGLVRRAALLPDTMGRYAETVTALRDGPDAANERNAVAEALLAQREQSAETSRLASLLTGAILADHALGRGRLGRKELQDLVAKANDPLLMADLPSPSLPGAAREPLLRQSTPLRLVAPEAGTQAILDAVPLDADRYLIALGEAGCIIVDRFGRTLARFAVPCEKLVIASSRQVALALARRDTLWRVSRLDLANRRIADLGMLACRFFADEFDGIAWSVATEDRLYVLDTERSLREVLWQVSVAPARITALTHSPQLEQIVVNDGTAAMLWLYLLPERRLVARDQRIEPSPVAQFQVLSAGGFHVDGWVGATAAGTVAIHLHQNGQVRQFPLDDGPAPDGAVAAAGTSWIMVGVAGADARLRWHLIYHGNDGISAEIDWPDPLAAGTRQAGADCVMFDRRGRLLHLDTMTSRTIGLTLR
jgi:hypothetical protein